MKTCCKCNLPKELADFYRDSRSSDGLRSECRLCLTRQQKLYRQRNSVKIIARVTSWVLANHDKVAASARARRIKNRDKISAYHTAWRNRNLVVQRGKNSVLARRRYQTDPQSRLATNLRGRIYKALRDGQAVKSARTFDLLGCPVLWLEVHLESLFRPGMTWENRGPVWHIDHIKPCAKFNLTDPEQQKICFHWTNLQPLFAGENLSKGAKYVEITSI